MPLPSDGIQPDRFELRLRFIFGALAGVAVGCGFLPDWPPSAIGIALIGLGAVAGGLLARHFGDRFWRAFLFGWPRSR